MASKWENLLKTKAAGAPYVLKSAKKFYSTYKPWIDKYHGGMPIGFMASIAALESNGTMIDVGNEMGEVGFYSVAAHTEVQFGLPKDFRRTPEHNIFIAALEYNVEAKRLQLTYPGLVRDGTKDQWLLARLVFAIGAYGANFCIKNAIAHSAITPGRVFDGVLKWADDTGAESLGSQPAGKVWYRIHMVNDVNWPIGAATVYQNIGSPRLPPAPAGTKFIVPKDVRGKIASENSMMLALASAGLLLLVV